eukprot:TRINITY_DN24252_c0_g1_i1.p1 TRINITY_DN24252_c0_g1~~TRINITY_DN24252_c0_g1_i1.p1  ORF type:complete len:496 (+),score=65.30 TRINITY_DN24252_c0_g1_i1:91-1488(+)
MYAFSVTESQEQMHGLSPHFFGTISQSLQPMQDPLYNMRDCSRPSSPEWRTPRQPSYSFTAGALLVLLSTVFFSFASVCIKMDKLPTGNQFPVVELGFIRGVASLLMGVLARVFFKVPLIPTVGKRTRLIAVLRGVFDFAASNLFYVACTQLPIAVATVVMFTNPFFAGMFARLLLGEAYGPKDMVLTALAFSGVLCSVFPELVVLFDGRQVSTPISTFGLVCAVAGSVFQALQYVTGRMVTAEGLHFAQANAAYGLAAVLLTPVLLMVCAPVPSTGGGQLVPPWQWGGDSLGWTTCVIGSALFAQVALIQGLAANLPASAAALIRVLDIPMAMAWSVALLAQWPTGYEIVGASILAAACVVLTGTKWYESANAAAPSQTESTPAEQSGTAAYPSTPDLYRSSFAVLLEEGSFASGDAAVIKSLPEKGKALDGSASSLRSMSTTSTSVGSMTPSAHSTSESLFGA